MNEPTKIEFEEKYNVTISDEAFDYLKTFLWEICCDRNRKEFDKALKNCNVQELVDHCESKFQK